MADKLNCTPSNYQCGGRCIPNKYACKSALIDAGVIASANEFESLVNKYLSENPNASASGAKLTKALLEYGSDNDSKELAEKYGIPLAEAKKVGKALDSFLAGGEAGGSKKAGDNLQDPAQAGQYAQFYAEGKHLTHTPPNDFSIESAKALLGELKGQLPAEDYRKLVSALEGKGQPPARMRKEAGWGNDNPRHLAVLKSLMDADFRDPFGNFLSWRTGMQLDHKLAGSMGGTDTPDNWIWISSATNQTKGTLEAAVKKQTGLSPEASEAFVTEGLIAKLKTNADMTPDQYAKARAEAQAKTSAKQQSINAIRDNFQLMDTEQKAKFLDDAKGEQLKHAMQALVPPGGSYRFVPGARERGGGEYPHTEGARQLLKANIGAKPIDENELVAIAKRMAANSKGKLTEAEAVQRMFSNFPPADRDLLKKVLDKVS